MKTTTVLETDMVHGMIYKMHEDKFLSGRRVKVLSGDKQGIEGVVTFTQHTSTPLQPDKVRVWLDGHSCIDIFDYSVNELELIPMTYIEGFGYMC